MKIVYLVLFFAFFSFGQNQYPKDYFRSPLDIPLQLSGNFGELRPNHIHSGFDCKTNQVEGLNVYAAAEGYVSRIKVSEVGYGKAMYITHPNGFTTVYGHLQSGFGEIEKYIKSRQYAAQSYEIDVNLLPDELPVKKGEVIAISGNTGGVEGPHLHFEIRDTQSEKIINPLYFGFDAVITDTKKPSINSLWVYPIEDNTVVNQSQRPILVNLSLQNDGSYISEKVLTNGKIGFGISAFDTDDVSRNDNGIFKVATYLNGKPDFGYRFDTFSFEETRYVNALIDYFKYKKTGQRVQKLFLKNPYPLSLIKPGNHNGIITVLPNISQTCRIEVSDFNQNTTKINIPVQYSNAPAKIKAEQVASKYLVKAKRDNLFTLENVTVAFPANTFLEDFYMDFEVKNGVAKVHKDVVPAFSNFSITFEDTLATEKERENMFIGLVEEKKVFYNNTKRTNRSFTAYVKYLGNYQLLKDTVAPNVSVDNENDVEGKWISDQNELQFTIFDDLSGIKSYNGYLNGKWILLEYEKKTKKLVYHFSDGIATDGKNDLKVVVTDNVGNSTIFETHFFRIQKP